MVNIEAVGVEVGVVGLLYRSDRNDPASGKTLDEECYQLESDLREGGGWARDWFVGERRATTGRMRDSEGHGRSARSPYHETPNAEGSQFRGPHTVVSARGHPGRSFPCAVIFLA